MPNKTSPEIKERAPNQGITTIFGLSNMINQQSLRVISELNSRRLGSSDVWERMRDASKEIMELAKQLENSEKGSDKRIAELERKYKSEIVRLKRENNSLRDLNVSLSNNITNSTSASSDEVRVDKEVREILVKILANTETIKQQNKDEAEWLESKEVEVYNKKDAMLSNREVRAEIYRTQGEEALREMLREKKYEPSTVDKYIGLAKKDTCS